MTGRHTWVAQTVMVGVAMLFAGSVVAYVPSVLGGVGGGLGTPVTVGRSATATATPAPRPPEVKITHETCCKQAARFLHARWESTEPVQTAALTIEPAPPFDCSASVDASGLKGRFGCVGFLSGAVDHVATLSVTTAAGTFPVTHKFRTMGDRLESVKWFTEFEDPTGDPLACAAASMRIIQNYTTGEDKVTATQILQFGRALNRSRDLGLDPVAIAAGLTQLDARNNYHYYRYDTKEEATASAVYWLLRSGKPVVAITLAGQHAPLVVGFQGTYGTFYGDPVNKITGVLVQDPQRGDMRPETAGRRPDMYRTPGFQTGQPIGMDEWYRGEWWFGFAYTCCLAEAGGSIDRNDGAYALPHWAGKFVILVDDADTVTPSDREGRVRFR